jgi:hypothetical protein
MARNPEIEHILEAWWQLDHCHPSEKAKSRTKLNELLDAVIAKSDGAFMRDQIQNSLYSQYKDYCVGKRRAERVSVVQSAMKPKGPAT